MSAPTINLFYCFIFIFILAIVLMIAAIVLIVKGKKEDKKNYKFIGRICLILSVICFIPVILGVGWFILLLIAWRC
ncbi:MAG: hypothetical protein LUE96_04205 [Lachnospiraceae bacterium]|nr:hypothetical protein [Lachnospiraceae bacterium]